MKPVDATSSSDFVSFGKILILKLPNGSGYTVKEGRAIWDKMNLTLAACGIGVQVSDEFAQELRLMNKFKRNLDMTERIKSITTNNAKLGLNWRNPDRAQGFWSVNNTA